MISPVWGDRYVRSFDPTCERKEIRRLEVITGIGGRRAWSDEDKGRIVAESFAVGANVSAVARRYGLRPQQVYAWRRLARNGALALPSDAALGFVPVIAAESEPAPLPATPSGIERSKSPAP
jgi:transposase